LAVTPTDKLIKTAIKARSAGQLESAAQLLADASDRADPNVDALYLRLLAEMDRPKELHAALYASIDGVTQGQVRLDPAHLRYLLYQSEAACLAPETIARLLATMKTAMADSPDLEGALQAGRRRQRFRRLLSERLTGAPTLISLGLNCMPWSLLNRWGMRSERDFDRLATPFSLGVHKLKAVLRALDSDFFDYFYLPAIRTVESEKAHHIALRTDLTAMWNHNRGPYWLADECAALRANLDVKIENFRQACRSENAVFLIGKSPTNYPTRPVQFLPNVNESLKRYTGRAQNRLIIFNEFADTAAIHQLDPFSVVVNCPYPASAYVWFDVDTVDTPEGLDYEHDCVAAATRILIDWGQLAWPSEKAPARAAGVSRAVG
jgi:hypothetical protein